MNKGELITDVAEKTGLSKTAAKEAVNFLFETIHETLAQGERVQLKGFGTFNLRPRAARKGRNPQTGEEIDIPALHVPYFIPSKAVKQKVIRRSRRETGLPKIIAVTSGKGGTGKTNFVINTAIGLAQKGLKVYVIDADLGTANVDVLLGISSRSTISDLVDGSKTDIMEIVVEGPGGIRIVPGGSGLQSLTELSEKELDRVIGLFSPLEDHADIILIDTGSGISRSVVNFAVAADEIIVVINPEPHSITDAYAILKVLSTKEKRPPVKMVFNMVESPKEARDVAFKLLEVTGRFLDIKPEPLGYILKDPNVVKSIKMCKPFILHNPSAPASKCVMSIVEKINPLASGKSPVPLNTEGFFSKLRSFFSAEQRIKSS